MITLIHGIKSNNVSLNNNIVNRKVLWLLSNNNRRSSTVESYLGNTKDLPKYPSYSVETPAPGVYAEWEVLEW